VTSSCPVKNPPCQTRSGTDLPSTRIAKKADSRREIVEVEEAKVEVVEAIAAGRLQIVGFSSPTSHSR